MSKTDRYVMRYGRGGWGLEACASSCRNVECIPRGCQSELDWPAACDAVIDQIRLEAAQAEKRRLEIKERGAEDYFGGPLMEGE